MKYRDTEAITEELTSLPAWECGLKSAAFSMNAQDAASLPAWECGLKYELNQDTYRKYLSLPAWECGLKSVGGWVVFHWIPVTPCVGVWIEIRLHDYIQYRSRGHSLRGSVD